MDTLLHEGCIVNEGEQFFGSILIHRDRIAEVFRGEVPQSLLSQVNIVPLLS